jgi:hypothetical protein
VPKNLVIAGILLNLITLGWWIFQPPGRHIGTYDIGNGRCICIWSEQEDWIEPNVSLYYRVEENGKVIRGTRWIGWDGGKRFDYRIAFAEGGKLACLYEVNLPRDDSSFIIFDAESRESCPGDDSREKWPARYRKLREANPEILRYSNFEE